MTFANPHMLWLLLVIPPALLAFFWWAGRTRQRLLTQFIQARLLPALTVGISARRQKIRVGCLVLAVVCLILALARPQWGFDWQEMKQRGLDVVVAIDTSKSMLAEDIAPNRLARAKLAALELMQRAGSDRLGLVAFAGSAFLQCPLTIDDAAFRQSVEALNVNIIPQGGTAIAEAIETALTAFKEGDNYKVLVLFTDGEDHDSGAVEAAEKAAKAGMRIFAIGIGTAEGELLRIKDAQGGGDYIRDEQGNVVKSHLNERLLQQIAGATEGGFYLPLRGAKAIDTLYDQGLAKLPKSEHQEKFVRQYHDRYHWPLAVAIVLLLVEMLFPERKREPKTKPAATPSAQSALHTAATVLLLLLLPTALRGSPASALREYKAGQYDQALKEYEQLLKRKGEDPRLHFNAGAAAYRNQQFEEAAKQFNASLAAPDLKLQGLAYYNEGNALYHLGEQNPDPKKRKEAWEKAVQDYQSTAKLNPQDEDAKFNYEFVKRKLEELKQQQQQSQQDKSDQQKDEDKKQEQQNQQQQQQDQQKKDQQQQQQAQQKQSEEKKKDSAQQEQQKKQSEQQQQQAAKQSQEQKEKQQQEQQQAKQSPEQPKDKGDEKEQEAAAAQAAGQMTPQQAQQLLDAQKEDEQMLPPQPTGKPADRSRPIKDW
jgi:Ca-activated chloride channel family protein